METQETSRFIISRKRGTDQFEIYAKERSNYLICTCPTYQNAVGVAVALDLEYKIDFSVDAKITDYD